VDRREFFKRLLGRSATRGEKPGTEKFFRPPYALPENEFLLYCSRCGDCTRACPHHTIFAVPDSAGAQVAKTPALDLLNNSCHLCADWPCVTACETGALRQPAVQQPGKPPPPPRLSNMQLSTALCLAHQGKQCDACRNSCPVNWALIWEQKGPRINASACTGCAMCRAACVADPKAFTPMLIL
jgi:ferredoxin-type protein NapG